jgi:hypothetical protein
MDLNLSNDIYKEKGNVQKGNRQLGVHGVVDGRAESCAGVCPGGHGMMEGQKGKGSQQMSGTMHDMAGQMMSMTGNMAKGNMSAAQQKQMAGRMKQEVVEIVP